MKHNLLSAFVWMSGVVAAIVSAFCDPTISGVMDYIVCLVGVYGILYCLCCLFVFIFKPLTRDWILINGDFMLIVLNFVMFVPLCFTPFFTLDRLQWHLGFAGDNSTFTANIFLNIWYYFIDPGNQHAAITDEGRVAAMILGTSGVFLLNGLLVSTLVGWFEVRKDKIYRGEIPYAVFLRKTPHYVVIGGCDVSVGIVRQIYEKYVSRGTGLPYVVLQTTRDVGAFRRELLSALPPEAQRKVIFRYGSRTSFEDVSGLELQSAEEIYVIGEGAGPDDIESYHDTLNVKCLKLIAEDLNKKSSVRKTCRVMFEHQTTFSVFQFSEISDNVKEYIDFKPFNYYEMWAQKVLVRPESIHCLPLDGYDGISEGSDDFLHLIVFGFSRMGVALAIETAYIAHFPNFVTKGKRTKITLIDSRAMTYMDYFTGRFEDLCKLSHMSSAVSGQSELIWNHVEPYDSEHLGGDFLDVEWEFIEGSVEQKAVRRYLRDSVNETSKTTIAFCWPEPNRALAAALYLERCVYEKVFQILVYNRYDDSLTAEMMKNSVHGICSPFMGKIHTFGMTSSCFDYNLIDDAEFIAQKLSDEYTRFAEKECSASVSDSRSGKSDVAKWWSNIYAANTLGVKLRSFANTGQSLSEKQLDILSVVEHNRWNMEQLLMGFRPLTETEMSEVVSGIADKGELKSRMAHVDICSGECLKSIDPEVLRYDRCLSAVLPEIYVELTTRTVVP